MEDSASNIQDSFKTFIVRFIDNKEYTFYNVEKPKDGRNNDEHNVLGNDVHDRALSYSTGSHNLPDFQSFNKINTSRESNANINSQVQAEEESF